MLKERVYFLVTAQILPEIRQFKTKNVRLYV